MKQYNVAWDKQSTSSFDNMPLSGRFGAGANVWVQDGELWIYLAHNGAYDENEKLLKLGAVRIKCLGVDLHNISEFKQVLDLQKAQISISFTSGEGMSISMTLRYVAENLAITARSSRPVQLEIAYGNWRKTDGESFDIRENGLSFVHRNTNSNYTLDLAASQHVPAAALANIIENRSFGGFITADKGLKFQGPQTVQWQKWTGQKFAAQTAKSSKHTIVVATGAGKGFRMATLQKKAEELCKDSNLKKAYALEDKRWREFWNRSYININERSGPDDAGFQIAHNYQLFRYMLNCNDGGELPLKFNGGIFTVDSYADKRYSYNMGGGIGDRNPDYRLWGSLFMGQNQRWIGWCTVASGDTALMSISRKFYRDNYATAKQRAQNLGASGACYVEALSPTGLCIVAANSQGISEANHLRYHFVMGLENAWQALCIRLATGADISRDLPWMVDVVRFYDVFYRQQHKKRFGTELNEQGKLVLYPASGLELTGDATNPIETVAALRAVTDGLQQLSGLPEEDRLYLTGVKNILPELPQTTKNGKPILALADKWGALYNGWELPELYAAWPYRLIGVTKPGTEQIGINTWNAIGARGDGDHNDTLAKKDYSWMPTWINMAALGMTAEAKQRGVAKLSYRAIASPDMRFTAFFGPGHDWLPDHNWGGGGMVGLQEMLLAPEQTADGRIYLFPAWPQDWDVDFKLYAPGNTIINCTLRQGRLLKLEVSPAKRKEDIVLPAWLKK